MVYHRVTFPFFAENPMQNMRTTSFEAITWWPIEISVKFQNRLIGNLGSLIRWSRDQWSRVVTWPAFWKLGQGAAQECGVSRSPMEISEKFQKRTNSKSGVADRMVTWPLISGGHVTYFLETRSKYSTKMWRISVTDGDIREIPKATNRKSGVADQMVTWPLISGGHVTSFLETRSKYSTKCDVSRSPTEISKKFQKRPIANQGSPIRWSRDHWSRVVTWPTFWKLGQSTAQKCDISRSLLAVYGTKIIFFDAWKFPCYFSCGDCNNSAIGNPKYKTANINAKTTSKFKHEL